MREITVKVTDKECVALRKSLYVHKEVNRVKVIMETLGCDERTALRFDWFAHNIGRGPAICNEAIAAAWVANEAFGYDGVNSPLDGWPGTGGGDYKTVDGVMVPVEKQ